MQDPNPVHLNEEALYYEEEEPITIVPFACLAS
jgi:hypothetical protein